MSKLIPLEIPADTSTFEKSLTDRAAEFERISAQAREKGAIHHRFGIGEGFVQIVDEWLSAEAFGEFFADPDRARVITVQVVVPARLAATDDEAIDLVGDRLDGLYWTGSMARDA